MSTEPDDPLIDAFRAMMEKQRRLVEEHERLRLSAPYVGAMRQIDRYITDYGSGVNAIDLYATRHSAYFDQLLSLRIKPHFVQSIIAAGQLIKEGFYDPAKREMRFLLEASVKALWLDQGSPAVKSSAEAISDRSPRTVTEKAAALDTVARARFDEVVDSLKFGLLDEGAAALYKQTAKSLYGRLSTITHITSGNIERDLANFDRGKHFGFETVKDVDAIAKLIRQVLDFALASHFEAFDHNLVGDLFEPIFQPDWSFLRAPLVAAVDRHFDYKHERRVRRGEVQ